MSEDFAALQQGAALTEEREEAMLDAWLRGVTWTPILIRANIEDGRWVIKQARGADVALFLAKRQRTLAIQVLDNDGEQASNERLSILKAGLFNTEGKRCSVLFARITY